jgi:sigma-54 dependent transcriptional regulator, acetoin dehydrogenase operon transcriptional activator AcoR
MSPADERLLAQAHAVRARGNAMPPDGMPSGLILDSWVRCARSGLEPGAALQIQVVDQADLDRRRASSEVVRRLAQAELETLSQQIAGSNFLLAFADHEGVILDLFADNRFSMSGADAGIVPGSLWREELCGTNGLGTALATGQAVAVTGLEHYFLKLGEISCTAAPVRDAAGDVVGVLDASSYFESRQRHTQALVQMAATHIENGLLLHQMRGEIVLAIHPRAEYLATLSAGLLACDRAGRLLAVDARARRLLAGLDARRGASFEDLFGEPFERVLARLHLGHEVRLRDSLGSSLVATAISRPPPRRTGAAFDLPSRICARPVDKAVEARPGKPVDKLRDKPLDNPWDNALDKGKDKPVEKVGIPPAGRHLAAPAFVVDDPAVADACRTVRAAVRMNVPILIQGETGSGKEMLARQAHALSGRRGEFVAVNCGALPAELFEAELFGYVGGAFTGARREGSVGLIASADGGTLLLDEVGELPPGLQAALLRFLDDRCVRPVGATASRVVDVQLLAATNVALEDQVAARRFRADLLFRLNVVNVVLPPLRRRQDFALAVRSVLAGLDGSVRITGEAVERLSHHGWPGNFRELRTVLTRALLAASERGDVQVLTLADVAGQLPAAAATGTAAGTGPTSALQQSATDLVLREFERNGRSVSRTSRSLGISRTTVYRHLREAGQGVAPGAASTR